jgi:hypothetical protein
MIPYELFMIIHFGYLSGQLLRFAIRFEYRTHDANQGIFDRICQVFTFVLSSLNLRTQFLTFTPSNDGSLDDIACHYSSRDC